MSGAAATAIAARTRMLAGAMIGGAHDKDQDVITASASPAGFAMVATRDNPEPYIPERYHAEMSQGMVAVEQGRLELLVDTCPVQHGKTATTSVWGSAWMLGLHPTWHVIAATHSTDFAEDKIGRPARDILERHGPRFFGVTVDQIK